MKKLITIAILLIMVGCGNEDEDKWFCVYENVEGTVTVCVDSETFYENYETYETAINRFGDQVDNIDRGPVSKCDTKGGCHED